MGMKKGLKIRMRMGMKKGLGLGLSMGMGSVLILCTSFLNSTEPNEYGK